MLGAAKEGLLKEIIIQAPDGSARTVRLENARMALGRSSANELCFAEDAGLSRQHLVFERNGDGWQVKDLGSKNGTLVNGQRITAPRALQPGDRISAGHLIIDCAGAPAADQTVIFVEPLEISSGTGTVVTSLSGALSEGSGEGGMESSPQVKALVRAGRELSGHMPLNELFELIMKLSIEAVGAARGVLLTLDGEELIVRAARGEGFRISNAVRDRLLRDKSSILVRDARLDQVLRDSMSIVEQQIRSILAVPLQTDNRVIGIIYLDSPHFVHEFTREDLNLLTVMANIAAIRIEHARLSEVEAVERVLARDMSQAAEIQRRLLPTKVPQMAGVELAGYNAACRTVGGDYYDFIPFPGGEIGMIVGDVAGKGMPAALLMSSLQARVQVLFDEPHDLASRVTRLNRSISTNCPDNRFITFFVGSLDPRNGEFTFCNAGHNPGILVRQNGDVEWLSGGGIILGIMPQATYEQSTRRVEPGDTLVLYSDGVTEARQPNADEEFGEERLASIVAELRGQPAASIVAGVIQRLTAWMDGVPAADDVTLVVARRTI
ncbi:MAG TPA: SpoIIE family protein phosphatase [Bryobacteraceae bacterium]|nr:SpoIIE family protein phosphatase [Bryobacteraceae bacterium]